MAAPQSVCANPIPSALPHTALQIILAGSTVCVDGEAPILASLHMDIWAGHIERASVANQKVCYLTLSMCPMLTVRGRRS